MIALDKDAIARLKKAKICFSYADDPVEWIDEAIIRMPGNNVIAEDYSSYFVRTEFYNIGAFSYSWSPLYEFVHVGRYCSIAGGVEIIPFSHPTNVFTTSSMLYDKNIAFRRHFYADAGYENSDALWRAHPTNAANILIGNDVYIGTLSKIRGGIKIGNGAIIGAYSVITKDVEPYTVVAGNPATVKKLRYTQSQIDKLEQLAWWNYDFKQILENADIDNIDLFIDKMHDAISRNLVTPLDIRKNNILDLIKGS